MKYIRLKILYYLFLFFTLVGLFNTVYWYIEAKYNLQNMKIQYVQKQIENKIEYHGKHEVENCFSTLKEVSDRKRVYHELWMNSEISYHLILSLISFILALYFYPKNFIFINKKLLPPLIKE